MKKSILAICCTVGACMIGFFAKDLNSATGAMCFAFGVILLVGAIGAISKYDTRDKLKLKEKDEDNV